MKKRKFPLLKTDQLAELIGGSLAGGFSIIETGHLLVAFGGDETNNCKGGNCVAGCTEINNVPACGGALNVVAGCGAST